MLTVRLYKNHRHTLHFRFHEINPFANALTPTAFKCAQLMQQVEERNVAAKSRFLPTTVFQ